MRFIGYLPNQTVAEQISSLLRSQGIQNLVEADDAPRWAVWVIAEDDLEKARQVIQAYETNPHHPAFAQPPVLEAATEPARKAERSRRQTRILSPPPDNAEFPYTTVATIILCVLVAGLTTLGTRVDLIRWFQISEIPYRLGASFALFLPEVRSGQVWRIVSPAFLHFGLPHILFNMWAFWDLAGLIERRAGPARLIALMTGLAVISNLGQYLAKGPGFGGMSGVIYGLLGYAWMMGRYRPEAGIALHPQSVVMMLVWFFVCLTDALGVPVANAAHGFGLIAGIFWGRLHARFSR